MRLAPDEASHFGTFGSIPPRGGSTITVVSAPALSRLTLRPTWSAKNLASFAPWADALRFANSTACRPDSTPTSAGALQQSPKTPTPQ